jgi:hypothetical protein
MQLEWLLEEWRKELEERSIALDNYVDREETKIELLVTAVIQLEGIINGKR